MVLVGLGSAASRTRAAVRGAAVTLLAVSFAFFATAAEAEAFVLVYAEGNVAAVPGGTTITNGQQVDGTKVIQLGPADKAIFISQSGNVIRHDGPFCGLVAQSQDEQSAGPAPAGCQK